MDSKSKIFFVVLGILVFGSVIVSYVRIYVQRDYLIQTQISCDPDEDNCFVSKCNSDEDFTCSKDPAEQTSYYKIIEKKAYNIPLCDPNKTECPELSCAPQEEDCQITLCTPDNADGATCSNDSSSDLSN